MKIRNQLIFGFISIILLLVFIAGSSFYVTRIQTDLVVFHSVENLAKSIVLSLAATDEKVNIPPIYSNIKRLQAYVDDFKKVAHYDIVVVDINQKILADIEADDINTIFNYDTHDEVGKTIRDGMPRIFIEQSKDYPDGAYSLVVPLKNENKNTIIGAVVLEYTSLLNESRKTQANYFLWIT